MTIYTGIKSIDTDRTVKLTIREGYISFTDEEYNEPITRKIHIDTTTIEHFTGIDSSGGEYEKIRYNGPYFYDWTIIGRGDYRQTNVTIQTWNRKEYYISMVQEVKLVGRGKNARYAESSSHKSIIIDMHEDSAQALATLFDQVKANFGSKVWR